MRVRPHRRQPGQPMARPRWRRAACWLGTFGLALATGCSDELGRVTFYAPGLAETSFAVPEPTRLRFAENLELEGPAQLETVQGDFRLEIAALQAGEVVGETECDPVRVGASWARSRRPSSTRIGLQRLSLTEAELTDCWIGLPRGGATTLRARFVERKASQAQPVHLELIVRR